MLRKAAFYDWGRSDDEFGEPAEVLGDRCQRELKLGATRPAQSQTAEPQDTLEMGKQHLDAFALAARLLESLGFGERPGNIASLLEDVTRDNAESGLWTALRLEQTAPTVGRAGAITKRLPVDHCALSSGSCSPGRYRRCAPCRM